MTALISSSTTITVGTYLLNNIDADGVKTTVDKDGFDGWGVPSPSFAAVPKTRQAGGRAGESYTGSRAMALRGLITAPTPELLTRALDAQNAAVSNKETFFQVAEAGSTRWCIVRRSDEIIQKRLTNQVASYAFRVTALDHRKLHATLSGSTSLPSTTGGLTVPFTVPVVIDAVQATGQITLTNAGNTAGPVFGRIDGPCVGPIVTHAGPGGGQLVFASSLVLAAGEWLDIDYERHEVLANGQASRNGYILARGWSTFEPGVNTWSFTAASFNAASQLTITATPADD